VGYVLADPNLRTQRYVAITSDDPGRYILVPADSVVRAQDGIAVNASAETLAALPHLTQGDIEQRYPIATTAQVQP
jgi:hypothetical protein